MTGLFLTCFAWCRFFCYSYSIAMLSLMGKGNTVRKRVSWDVCPRWSQHVRNTVLQTVLGIGLMLVVDTCLASRATKQARQRLGRAMDRLQSYLIACEDSRMQAEQLEATENCRWECLQKEGDWEFFWSKETFGLFRISIIPWFFGGKQGPGLSLIPAILVNDLRAAFVKDLDALKALLPHAAAEPVYWSKPFELELFTQLEVAQLELVAFE